MELLDCVFEKDVNMYGSQAGATITFLCALFEKDVNMYGSQATKEESMRELGLRRM